jgi:hypothetical protein
MALTAVQARWRQVKLIARDYLRAIVSRRGLPPYQACRHGEIISPDIPPSLALAFFWRPSAAVDFARGSSQNREAVGVPGDVFIVTREQRGKQWKLPAALRARLGHRNIL